MYVKIHTSKDSQVIAVCDEDLLGKTLKNSITITVSESFYKGEKKSEEEVIEILLNAKNINLIGKKSIEAGIKAGVIEKESIKEIQGVPYGQAFSF